MPKVKWCDAAFLLAVCCAAASAHAAPAIVTGTDVGGQQVRRFDPPALTETASIFLGSTGGVRVAVGDVNGDAVEDLVVGAGPGGAPQVSAFDGVTLGLLFSFFAYDPTFTGGVFVAAADFNGDGRADIVTGSDAGMPALVRVFDAVTLAELESFSPFPSFTGGARVAAGLLGADAVPDLVVGAGPGGAPLVTVFDSATSGISLTFAAYAPSFLGGVYVAAGDITGDGRAEIVTGPGAGGTPQVGVFDGVSGASIHSFLAFPSAFLGGVRVAAGRVNGDLVPDIVAGAGPGGGPNVVVFDGVGFSTLHSFFAYDPTFTGGVFVAAPFTQGVLPVSLLDFVVE